MSTPREIAESISKGNQKEHNLDVNNLTIWKAQLVNLELTKPMFRSKRVLAKIAKTKKEIERLTIKDN